MKQLKNTLTLFFILGCLPYMQAQQWCEPGATWHYTAGNMNTLGVAVVVKTGTVQLNNHVCDAYQAHLVLQHFAWVDTISFPTSYTYFENNKVYAYSSGYNCFYKLYDFNAQVGDSWYIYGPDSASTGCSEDSSLVLIDSLSTIIVNGDTLTQYFLSTFNTGSVSPWAFGDHYTEKIGGNAFIFPNPYNCLADGAMPYLIRCYSDSSGFSYQNSIAPACDFISAIQKAKSEADSVRISPNPFYESCMIQVGADFLNAELKIYTPFGDLLHYYLITDLHTQIKRNGLAKGLYFYQIANNFGKTSSGKFVVD